MANGNGGMFVEKSKFNITLKDFIMVIIFVTSMLTGYINMQSKVTAQDEQIQELKKIINDNNLSVMNYKLSDLQNKIDKVCAKLGVL